MNKVTVRVPATSANCGPGFDTLGLAVNLYNEVTYEITDTKGFQLKVEGEGAEYLKPFGRNLAFASFLKVWNLATDGRRIGLKVSMLNRIPMSRGLGSSSSAIVAGLFAANCLCDNRFSMDELWGSLRKSRDTRIMWLRLCMAALPLAIWREKGRILCAYCLPSPCSLLQKFRKASLLLL